MILKKIYIYILSCCCCHQKARFLLRMYVCMCMCVCSALVSSRLWTPGFVSSQQAGVLVCVQRVACKDSHCDQNAAQTDQLWPQPPVRASERVIGCFYFYFFGVYLWRAQLGISMHRLHSMHRLVSLPTRCSLFLSSRYPENYAFMIKLFFSFFFFNSMTNWAISTLPGCYGNTVRAYTNSAFFFFFFLQNPFSGNDSNWT